MLMSFDPLAFNRTNVELKLIIDVILRSEHHF